MSGLGSLLRALVQAARGVFRRDTVTREIDDEILHFTFVPARRAVSVDPLVALRSE